MTKGILNEDQRAKMREATHEAAIALVDDLGHVRTMATVMDPNAGDIRRFSNQLRRLLIEGALVRVAAPRTGKIHIEAPDAKLFHHRNDKAPFPFAFTDTVTVFGIQISVLAIEQANSTPMEPQGFDSDARIKLPVDTFCNQRVLCYQGRWVTRANVIKYIANVAHGVHSGEAKEDAHALIRHIRYAMRGSLIQGVPSFGFDLKVFEAIDPPLPQGRDDIDIALLSLRATAQHLVQSDDIKALETSIHDDG
jgi:hypothetical protein